MASEYEHAEPKWQDLVEWAAAGVEETILSQFEEMWNGMQDEHTQEVLTRIRERALNSDCSYPMTDLEKLVSEINVFNLRTLQDVPGAQGQTADDSRWDEFRDQAKDVWTASARRLAERVSTALRKSASDNDSIPEQYTLQVSLPERELIMSARVVDCKVPGWRKRRFGESIQAEEPGVLELDGWDPSRGADSVEVWRNKVETSYAITRTDASQA
jgi:hypothetical protein